MKFRGVTYSVSLSYSADRVPHRSCDVRDACCVRSDERG